MCDKWLVFYKPDLPFHCLRREFSQTDSLPRRKWRKDKLFSTLKKTRPNRCQFLFRCSCFRLFFLFVLFWGKCGRKNVSHILFHFDMFVMFSSPMALCHVEWSSLIFLGYIRLIRLIELCDIKRQTGRWTDGLTAWHWRWQITSTKSYGFVVRLRRSWFEDK